MASAHVRGRYDAVRHCARPLGVAHHAGVCAASSAPPGRPAPCYGPWSPMVACTPSLYGRASRA
eukprot:14519931-Alexandrium_andersonii.AAC.1